MSNISYSLYPIVYRCELALAASIICGYLAFTFKERSKLGPISFQLTFPVEFWYILSNLVSWPVRIFHFTKDSEFGSQINLPRLVEFSVIAISRHLFGGALFLHLLARISPSKLQGVFSLRRSFILT